MVVKLTPERLAEIMATQDSVPAFVDIKRHADAEGGIVLRAWQLMIGHLWGLPELRTGDEAALELGISRVELEGILNATRASSREDSGHACPPGSCQPT